MRQIRGLSEKQLVEIWQHLLNRTELVTEDGEPIRVIYPGRKNDGGGADFRDAVIATRHGLLKGDIEVHLKSSDWRSHRHQHNSAYDRVVLHVVLRDDVKSAASLHQGKNIPTLALDKFRESLGGQWLNSPPALNTPCLGATERMTTGVIAQFLDAAGKERFSAKAAEFYSALAQTEASQVLYQGIMGALGYSKNKLPFLELARRLPLRALESIFQEKMTDEEYLARQQALLLGTAGLLPSQCPKGLPENKLKDRWTDKLERLWSLYPRSGAMSANAWHRFRVRPNNSPVRRMVAMSHLLLRYRERGILEELAGMVKRAPIKKGYHQLEESLVVTTSGRWLSHFDFDSSGAIDNLTLLGARRAADIVVNVILPFVFAWSWQTFQTELESKVLHLYYCYPKLVANAIERHMSCQLGLKAAVISSAQRQQGLIYIYRTLCIQGGCTHCPLSQLKVRHNQT